MIYDNEKISIQEWKGIVERTHTYDDLREVLVAVLDRNARVQNQIDTAKAKVYTHNMYSDPSWFASANAAKRGYGILIQMINAKLGTMKSARSIAKAGRHNAIQQAFVDICRARLDPVVFIDYMEEAKATVEDLEAE